MLLKKRFMFFVVLALLICVGQAAAGSNANAVVSLDLIADGGAGNQIDDGVTSGTVSGQGTKIAVEVFAKGVVTSLVGVAVKFDFDTSVLMLDSVVNSPFTFFIPDGKTAVLAVNPVVPLTLAGSGFIARLEFFTVMDVTGKEFSLGISTVTFAETAANQDEVTSTSKIEFNRDKQITAADADFDGSGVVDIADFLQFVDAYGTANAKYDLDGDGVVGISDFLTFVDLYGQTVQTVPVDNVEEDRAALVALYNATDGDNWTNNTNWLSDKPLGEWHGISTNAQGRVDSLVLFGNQLSGAIPPELGNLTNLKVLGLHDNQLSGTIPPEIGNLSQLEVLFLASNRLSGAIPSQIGDLSNLLALFLHDNQLSGPIPVSFGRLDELEYLFLVNIPGLCMPAALKDWRFYNTEGVSKCDDMTGSVDGDRAALVALYNATNGANWTNNTNWLSDKPLGEWHGVRTDDATGRVVLLSLYDNQMSGPIPPELGNLTDLQKLALPDNQLSGPIPSELGNLAKLEDLRLYRTQLTGTIPASLSNLSNLTRLSLSENQLTGTIPPELGNLANLTSLHLGRNQLSGPIPPELGNLSNLEFLRLFNNQNLCMPISLIDWKFYETNGVSKCSE